MSEIDWSKAPEGAMCYVHDWGFFKCEHGEWWVSQGAVWQRTPYSSPANFSWFGNVVWRGKEWNGEGLPPVGVRCEAAIPHTSGPDNERSFIWIEGSVIAYYEIKGKTYAWFAEDDGFYPPNVLEFRPIRTPEQIAADEQNKAVAEMMTHVVHATPIDCELLYRAGYRKQEQPK